MGIYEGNTKINQEKEIDYDNVGSGESVAGGLNHVA